MRSGLKRAAVIGVAALLGITGLFLLADRVTSTAAICESCHEIRPRAASWRESVHSRVPCVDCHAGAYAWYELPQALVSRFSLLARDISAHTRGRYADPVDSRPPGVPPMSDDVCLACHTLGRQITIGTKVKIDHAEHAERNGDCVSCHLREGHPLPDLGNNLSRMQQCFTCHSQDPASEAPGECSACHPPDLKLRPESHESAVWMPHHGKLAKADQAFCAMCHRDAFCLACHGLVMPHPDSWGEESGHVVAAVQNRQVCDQCHPGDADMCTVCHHTDFNRKLGAWVDQHPPRVQRRGTKRCLECHAPTDCAACHAERGGQ